MLGEWLKHDQTLANELNINMEPGSIQFDGCRLKRTWTLRVKN